MKCDFCLKIGKSFSLELDLDNSVLKAFERFETILKIIPYSNYPNTILRCPLCQTYFMKRITVDNEILSGTSEVEFTEIKEQEARELITHQNDKSQVFAKKIDAFISTKALSLSSLEKRILQIFKDTLKENLSIYDIADALEDTMPEIKRRVSAPHIIYPRTKEQLEIFNARIMPSLNALLKKGVLKHYTASDIAHYRIMQS